MAKYGPKQNFEDYEPVSEEDMALALKWTKPAGLRSPSKSNLGLLAGAGIITLLGLFAFRE